MKQDGAKTSNPRGSVSNGKPLTPAQLADSLAEKVLAEDTSGDVNNAIRNLDKFYENDPDLSRPGVRMLVKGRLQKMARDPKFLESQAQRREAKKKTAPQGKGPSADEYLKKKGLLGED